MQFSNRFIGIVAVIGAIAIVYGTFGFRAIPGQQFGSAFFPRITAGCLALVGVAMACGSPSGPWITLPDWMRSHRALRAAALPLGGITWVLLAPYLGFILATGLLILALVLVTGGRLLAGLGVAVGLSLLLHVIFSVLLRIPLPFGLVEGWFS
ncbi:tripartite tricarboxylate transporter TctB family protein [Roseobacter sp. YSTF-M11]|uniref:Tripartite tricarboxylate transporter TctB family protein n=1 Tax=Roseobacter insulae TaxID=2859783 RepID=A0A9X1FZF3_9RHOB|nr:tripartite tricarboxylate transporter TctB family protein [Roseobacter insulae]MBW4709748.1 tripartite tricarboxylate transporter TctB family protein [Roseobacter insulae]